jgi:hypothetical protein
VANEAARACVDEHAINLGSRKPGVQWDRYHSEPAARIHELDVLGSIWKQNGQPIASLKTVSLQRCSNTRDAILKLAKRWPHLACHNRRPSWIVASGSA